MKRSFFSFICLGLLLFGPCDLIGALEIGIIGGINNMTFHPDRITAHGKSIEFKQFQNYPFGFGDFYLKSDISGFTGFNFNVSRDNILRNRASAIVTTYSDYFNVEFGPFVGINDNFDKPDIGIMGGIDIFYPGIVFLSLKGSSSLGVLHEVFGKNASETAEAKIGLWLSNMIPSFSVSTKNYTNYLEDSSIIRDELLRFQGSADFFAKNFPATVRFDAAYEVITRSYLRYNNEVIDELKALFVGTEIKWQITKPISIIAGFEIPIYIIGAASRERTGPSEFKPIPDPMKDPDGIFNLYKFHGGIAFTFF